MHVFLSALVGLMLACIGATQASAAQIHKCIADGKVSYQADPCPQGAQVPRPTVAQLNRERRQRLEAASAAGTPAAQPIAQAAPVAPAKTVAPAGPVSPATPYRCDGRTHCSQMRSCSEAKYFLANCPGVKMDGDGDGIPCEKQWCN